MAGRSTHWSERPSWLSSIIFGLLSPGLLQAKSSCHVVTGSCLDYLYTCQQTPEHRSDMTSEFFHCSVRDFIELSSFRLIMDLNEVHPSMETASLSYGFAFHISMLSTSPKAKG